MRILTFDKTGTPTLGIRHGDEIIDLSLAAPQLPRDLTALLAAGDEAMAQVAQAAASASAEAVIPVEHITYCPPIPNPPKILCLGLNYVDHASESPYDTPDYPILFTRVTTSLLAHNAPLVRPSCSPQFDY